MKSIISRIRRLPRHVVALSIVGVMALSIIIPATALAAPVATPTKCGKTDVKCVITFGDTRITDRLNALTTFSGKVTTQLNAKHITNDQATTLQTDVTTNQNGLNALKTKLDAETDAKVAREDVKNIYVQFRIFAVVLPRDYRHLHLDLLINVHDKLKDLEPKLEQSIDKTSGDEKTQLTNLYNDYKAQLATVEAQVDTAQNDLVALTVTSYNTTHTAFTTSLTSLKQAEKTIHDAIHQASKDLHQISQLLKKK